MRRLDMMRCLSFVCSGLCLLLTTGAFCSEVGPDFGARLLTAIEQVSSGRAPALVRGAFNVGFLKDGPKGVVL